AASQAALLDEQAVSELRDEFIAVLGHDLRNPLAAIEAGVTLLGRAELDPRLAGVVTQMRASTGRMSRLINDVLDFARGRLGGGLPIERRPATALQSTLEQVIAELRAAHPERPIRTELAVARPVVCDPDRIGQLLSNLLANALVHGRGEVQVRALSDAAGLTLSVSNGGSAIPETERAQLFQPFKRDGASAGLGLGLYIAAQIAQAHGGELACVSSDAETRFTLRIPA
ncbi:MAG: HAMP domain-containing histidine kinase, partial [Brevundimonas sp.]